MKKIRLFDALTIALTGVSAIAGIPKRKEQKKKTQHDEERLEAARKKRARRNQKRLNEKGGAE